MIIRDPIHGDIELLRDEARILDSRPMQRLRGIKQLGTAHLVYPGCNHTRFEHSLGTVHAAQRILDSLVKKGHRVSSADVRLIRMAALVHDVTHIPFGHTFEDERKVFPRHDAPERVRRFLFQGELGDLLQSMGLASDLESLLVGGSGWQAEIVGGCVDADLLDYLRRDCYFAGLSLNYDDRIYACFCLEEGRLAVDMSKRGLERGDAWSEIVHLLRMRFALTQRVYFHHAKVISGAMISKALERAVDQGLVESDLYALGDDAALELLAARGGENARRLIDGVRRRRLLKRAYALSCDSVSAEEREGLIARYHASARERRELEEKIAEAAGVDPVHVIVYCPAATQLKEAALLARLPEGLRRLNETGRLELAALEEEHARIWRFWVFAAPGDEAAVGRAAEAILGLPNRFQSSSVDVSPMG